MLIFANTISEAAMGDGRLADGCTPYMGAMICCLVG